MTATAGTTTPTNRFADAPRAADFTIDQRWSDYTDREHQRWRRLYQRTMDVLQGRACEVYLEAARSLELAPDSIPDMARLSERLMARTGWRVVPVAGLVPDEVFFDHLAERRFPAGAFIRPESQMDYLAEPDIFHDIFGHVPLLANSAYAAFMQAYGQGGRRAMSLGRLANLARLYWYTIEFGLIRSDDGLRIFGAGILSSTAESIFALEDPAPHRIAFDLERVMRTPYRIDTFQATYFVIDSFEALLAACYGDFTATYARLAVLPDRSPDVVCAGDVLIAPTARGPTA